jgi:hypothetical protein
MVAEHCLHTENQYLGKSIAKVVKIIFIVVGAASDHTRWLRPWLYGAIALTHNEIFSFFRDDATGRSFLILLLGLLS